MVDSRDKKAQVIKATLNRLVNDYKSNPRKYLTENDIVIQAHRFLQDGIISNESKLSIHSEFRPYNFREGKGIHNDKWTCLRHINHASKCDVAIVDSDTKYWKITKEKIKCLHSKKLKKKKLRYWRFLVYPIEAFKAIFEFKMRVQGNLSNIREDIDKLVLIKEANSSCLTYMIVLDRKATSKSMNTIREYAREKDIPLLTHE